MKNFFLKILMLCALFALPVTSKAANNEVRGFLSTESFIVNFKDQSFELSAEQLNQARGTFVLPNKSNLVFSPVSNKDMENLFFSKMPAQETKQENYVNYNPATIFTFIENLANAVAKPPIEPVLKIKDNYATEFIPPSDGVSVDLVSTSLLTLKNIEGYKSPLELPYSTTSPKTYLAQQNNFGINELIAQGHSNYKGSPKNRIHNITVGVEKFKGLIIKQGEEFSFNKYLGPVEKEQGFLPELVIKKEGTVPELGGGLCQVSSTTFRAAMEAGLPITQRRNHAYAVQYYSPQGTDATIYPGVVDLKFVNNTPGDILVWPHFEAGDNLIFDFYGSKDNRKVTLETPRTYDRKTDGSMKAEWTRIVEKDGATSTSTFKSIYQSPALYHKHEEFVPATPINPPVPSPTPTVN